MLEEKPIKYTHKKSRRARRMRLTVYFDGSVVLTTPHNISESIVQKFIREKTEWLISQIDYFKKRGIKKVSLDKKGDFKKYKEQALLLAQGRVQFFNQHYGHSFNKINIRNQKTRWGSCSRKGNLNFNYKIALLPPELADYLVVHELCHIKEMNHSERFWSLVAQMIPKYKMIRSQFKKLA